MHGDKSECDDVVMIIFNINVTEFLPNLFLMPIRGSCFKGTIKPYCNNIFRGGESVDDHSCRK